MGDSGTGDLSFPQQAKTQLQAPNPTNEWTQRQAGPNFFKDGENVLFLRTAKVQQCRFRDIDNTLQVRVETDHFLRRTAQTHDSVMHQFIDVPSADITERRSISFELSFFTRHVFRVKFAAQERVLEALANDTSSFPPPEDRMLVGSPQDAKVQFRQLEDSCFLSTEFVEIHVNYKPFQLSAFLVGSKTPFWRQRLSDLFTGDAIPTSIAEHEGRHAAFEAFQLHPGEHLYGLGERFDAVSRRGRPVDFVNHDAIGTSNTRSYINVPFFWTTRGYGCFVNSYARTEWDMGMSETGTIGFCSEENHMDYFIISGPSPKDIISRYTQNLTGTSPLPPIWTFGLWLSRNSYQSWAVVDEVLAKCAQHRIPVDDIHLDTAWFKEDWNPDLIFDKIRFANHTAKMAQLKSEGVHVSLWQYTFAPPRQDNTLFLEGQQHGYFGMSKNADGTPSKTELFKYPPSSSGWKIDDAVIDYSNSSARAWYASKISSLIAQGASAIKTDFGDCIPPDAHYQNIDGNKFQNLYSLVYNGTITRAMKSVDQDTIVWARSGTAGSQRYPVHWGGDSQCSWAGLQGSLYATLAMGLSGFSFFATDTGGFIGKPGTELYVRWAQLSLLGASHSRAHGAGDENEREPWAFGEEGLRVFRKFVDLRYRLLPYIVQQCRDGVGRGLPLVRHLVLDWPGDKNVWGLETQYLFGEGILVAPVVMPEEEIGGRMDVYFPRGRWFDFWNKEVAVVSRGEWVEVDVPGLDSMAMWVREGAVLAYAEEGRMRTWNEVGRVVKVECYGGIPGEKWECGDGAGGRIVVIEDGKGGWMVEGRDGEVDVNIYS